jgi:hypothetical protein
MEWFHDVIEQFDGAFSPSDFSALGFRSIQAMRPHVRSLEIIGVVEVQKDEVDQRKKSITVAGKGWLVHWCSITHGR